MSAINWLDGNGSIAFSVPAPLIEDYAGFQNALLSSSFTGWANQSASHASAIAANFVARDFNQVRAIFTQLVALYPPANEQLSEWQAIADQHQITSVRFLP